MKYPIDGVREGTKEFLAHRDFFKRVYWVFETERGADTEPCMLGHTGSVAPVFQSLWSLWFGGEGFKPKEEYVYSDWYLQRKLVAPGIRLGLPEPGAPRDYDAVVYRNISPKRFPSVAVPESVRRKV